MTTVRERFGFSLDNELSAKDAALASLISFPVGSILPMLAMYLSPKSSRECLTFFAVAIALALTGYVAAHLNGADKKHAAVRNVLAGIFTMVVTFAIGSLFR